MRTNERRPAVSLHQGNDEPRKRFTLACFLHSGYLVNYQSWYVVAMNFTIIIVLLSMSNLFVNCSGSWTKEAPQEIECTKALDAFQDGWYLGEF
jgi:hypothetical protein